MAAEYPPFMNGYGTAAKILNKMKEAQTPDRFTQELPFHQTRFPRGHGKALHTSREAHWLS